MKKVDIINECKQDEMEVQMGMTNNKVQVLIGWNARNAFRYGILIKRLIHELHLGLPNSHLKGKQEEL